MNDFFLGCQGDLGIEAVSVFPYRFLIVTNAQLATRPGWNLWILSRYQWTSEACKTKRRGGMGGDLFNDSKISPRNHPEKT